MRTLRLSLLINSLLIVIILSTLSAHAAESQEKALIYGETANIQSFDPYTIHDAAAHRLVDLIFDPLISVGPGGTYEPALAKSWSIEAGGSSVLIQLAEPVFWHPYGEKQIRRPLRAADVATTIRLITNPKSEIPNQKRFDIFASTEVLSQTAIRIRYRRALSDPIRPLLFKVLPDHILGKVDVLKRDDAFVKQPVGTGPYQFAKTNAQGEILLQANTSYWRGLVKIPQIVMKPYADRTIMAQSLMYKALDLVTFISPKDTNEIRGDRQLRLIPYDALSFSFLALNNLHPVLKDRRVRQAINYAINRKEVLDAFFQGDGNLISGPFSPTSWAYNLDVKGYRHDPERAKNLLQAAGYQDSNQDGIFENPQGKPINLRFVVPVAGESEMTKRIALAMQSYLKKIGLGVELTFLDWKVWKEQVLGRHDYEITIASWSFDDAANISSLFHSSAAKPWGNNFVLLKNQRIDSMLTEAESTNDYDKRRTIYKALHAMLADEAPYVFLWTLKHHAAHRQELKGVQVEPFAFFKHILSWQKARL